jgi:hypothetical protein
VAEGNKIDIRMTMTWAAALGDVLKPGIQRKTSDLPSQTEMMVEALSRRGIPAK